MVKVVGIFAVVAVICALNLQTIERLLLTSTKPASTAMATNAVAPPRPESNPGSRTVTLQNDGRGHFQVEARVDGRWIDFLVDTGASLIALRESSAAKLGILARPDRCAERGYALGRFSVFEARKPCVVASFSHM